MQHRKLGYKLQVTSSHRKAMMANMLTSLFEHERIKTTVMRAKALSREADKMITLAKRQTLHSRRLVERDIKNKTILKKLFDDIGMRYTNRNGGYTRIIKMSGYRHGDGASLALIELTERMRQDETDAPKKEKNKEEKTIPKKLAAAAGKVKKKLVKTKAE